MKNSFLDIIRTPDDIKVYTETSPFRFEEPGHIVAVMLTYEGDDKTVWDIVNEFDIEPLDDYFNRCRKHREGNT